MKTIRVFKCRMCGCRVMDDDVEVAPFSELCHKCEYEGHHGIVDLVGYKTEPEDDDEFKV